MFPYDNPINGVNSITFTVEAPGSPPTHDTRFVIMVILSFNERLILAVGFDGTSGMVDLFG